MRRTETTDIHRTKERTGVGQTEVVALILTLTLSIASIGIIASFSAPVLSDGLSKIDSQKSDLSLRMLDSSVSEAPPNSSNMSISVDLSGGRLTSEGTSTYINITQEYTGGTWDNRSIYEGEVGSMRYIAGDGIIPSSGEEVVTYEMGGLWRGSEGSNTSVMISPPSIDLGADGASVTIYNITSNGSWSGERVSISSRVRSYTVFPNASYDEPGEEDLDNPVRNGSVYMSVESRNYRAWERYLDNSPYAEVESVQASENKVRARIINTTQPVNITTAGVSANEYTGNTDPFNGDLEEGVRYPTADGLVSDAVEYASDNPDAENLSTTNCAASGGPVCYYDGDYTVDKSFNIVANDVFVVVDGVVTIDRIEITGSNSLYVVATEGYRFNNSYQIFEPGSVSADRKPTDVVMYTPSDAESGVTFEGPGEGRGIIYAPGSTIDLEGMNDTTWNGSLVGENILTSGVGSNVTIDLGTDVGLKNVGVADRSLSITERRVRFE